MSAIKSSRLSLLSLLYLTLLLSLSTLAPTVVAQGNGNPPYPPGLGGAPAGQPEGPTPMRFRPPRDAGQMTDFLPEGAVAHGITNAPGLQNSVPLVPVKDNLVYLENNTVGVLLEDGMVDTPAAELHFRQQATPQYSPETTLTDDSLRMLIQFEVGIYDRPSGNEMRDWQSKARLIVDLRNLVDEADLGNASFFLMYRDEEDPDVWHPVDIDVHQETGLISAEVSHFSEWSAGITAERWSPSFIEPDVSTFSGAATYSYPIQVPAGRSGLQPSVALSYSSRAIDGRILDTDAGPVADGWSLADISIVRDGAKMENCSGNTRMLHEDKFRLTLNGAGHRLFAAPGAATKWGGLRYYAEDAPGYYIERLNNTGHTATTPRYYWGVITPNGTIYRMGYNERSEAFHSGPNGRIKIGDCSGTSVSRSGTAWYIDEVTDVHGNKIYYDYLTNTATEDQSGWTLTTTRRRIYDINYNHDNSSQPQARIRLLNGADNLTNYTYVSWSAELESIFIYDGGSSTPRLEYRLDTQDNVVASPGCKNGDTVPPSDRYNNTVTLESIQLVAGTDNNPDTADTPVGSLPTTTFTYSYKPHFFKNGQPCFQFYYLTGVDNGYGGSFAYTYLSDSRSHGVYQQFGAAWYEFPQIGYSYVVDTMARNDGQTSSTSVEYEYYKPCYDQWGAPTSGQFVDEFACGIGADDPPEFSGALVGFEWVTVRPKDSSGNVMNVTTTNFAQGADWRGRAKSVYTYQSNGTDMMQKVENTYITLTLSAGSKFTYLSQTKKTVYEPDTSGTNSIVTLQSFGYNTALQGGAYGGTQYGNQTVVWDYGNYNDGGADDRTIITCYYPNGSTSSSQNWLVGLPAMQRTFSGIITVSANRCNSTYTTNLLNETRTVYDFDLGSGTPTYNNYTTVPTKGLVTTTFSGKYGASLDGGTNGFIRGATFEYDIYGNPDTITSNSGVVTTVTYDSAVHMYPLSVNIDKLNGDFAPQTTTYQFYGVNSVSNSANGFRMPYGAVRKITDPNGLYQVMEYDPFGRLHATYEDESDRSPDFYVLPDYSAWDGDPVARYRYWDNSWNSSMYSGFISDPMAITEEVRPETFEPWVGAQNGEVSAMSTNIYYDGFGREIQTRSFTHQVYGVSGDQDLVTLIGYGDNGQADCQSVSFAVPRTSGLVTATCASKAHTTTDFDDLGRQTSVTTPDGNATTFAYYILANPLGMPGNATAVNTYDAEGRVRSNWMDARGQLIQVVDHTGTSQGNYAQYGYVNYEYDKLGNLTQVETVDLGNSRTLTTELQYDVLGRKVWMDDPDMGVWDYTYDAQGNLTVQKDAKNQLLCFYYDSLGRMTTKSSDSSSCNATPPTNNDSNWLASYIYDTGGAAAHALGQLTKVEWDRGSSFDYETFSYDNKGRLNTHTRVIEGSTYIVTNSAYDVLHRPITVNNAAGENLTLAYDFEGLASLKVSSTFIVTGVEYNERSQMARMTFQNGVTTTNLYAGSGGNFRLSQMQVMYGSSPRLVFNYSYDDVGNITKILEYSSLTGGPKGGPAVKDTQTFTYDELNRLKTAVGTHTQGYNYNLAYTYDAFGNIVTVTENAATRTYGYDYAGANDPPHAVDTITGGYTFDYDDNGNMESRVDSTGSYTQTFDKENRLSSVTDTSTGDVTTFYYDANGQRTLTIFDDGSTPVITHYPFADYTVENVGGGSSVVKRVSYFFGGQAVAAREITNSTNTLFMLHTDHLGSTSVATNSTNGNEVTGTRASYRPFGEERQVATTELNGRGYTGHVEDDYIKLVYMNARWYAPGLGRFLSADTIVPNPGNSQAFNRYSYVYNRPLVLIDPSGHAPACIPDGLGGCYQQPESQLLRFVGLLWTEAEAAIADQAAWAIAQKMAEVWNLTEEHAAMTAEKIFLDAYGGKVTMNKTRQDCTASKDCRAWVDQDERIVNVEFDYDNENKELFVHELFHVLDGRLDWAGGIKVSSKRELDRSQGGFDTPTKTYQKSNGGGGEIFADMGIGWTYDRWALDEFGDLTPAAKVRAEFMSLNMSAWLQGLVGQ